MLPATRTPRAYRQAGMTPRSFFVRPRPAVLGVELRADMDAVSLLRGRIEIAADSVERRQAPLNLPGARARCAGRSGAGAGPRLSAGSPPPRYAPGTAAPRTPRAAGGSAAPPAAASAPAAARGTGAIGSLRERSPSIWADAGRAVAHDARARSIAAMRIGVTAEGSGGEGVGVTIYRVAAFIVPPYLKTSPAVTPSRCFRSSNTSSGPTKRTLRMKGMKMSSAPREYWLCFRDTSRVSAPSSYSRDRVT